MTEFRKKSEFNDLASILLIKNHNYSPSIHCLYYCCLQYVIHILISRFGYTESSLITELHKTSKKISGGTHVFYLNKIESEARRTDKLLSREIKNDLGKLKILRENSDYKSIVITQTDSFTAERYKTSIILALNKLKYG